MRYLFVTLVPVLPLIGYALSGATPFSFSFVHSADAPHLLPQPRVRTGFPVAASADTAARRRGPSPFSWRQIRLHAAKWPVKKLETPRWKLMMTDTCAIRSDALIDDVRFAGVYLEEAFSLLKRRFRGDTDDIRFSIRIFRDRNAFAAYANCLGVPEADSFYNPRTNEVVVYRGRSTPWRRYAAALLHEFTHIYLHRVFDITEPLWLGEGLAEYVARYDVSSKKLRVGRPDPATAKFLKESLERGDWFSPKELLGLERKQFYGDRSKLAYAQSWLLVDYLLARQPEVIESCLTEKLTPKSLDMDLLEKELRLHLRKMK